MGGGRGEGSEEDGGMGEGRDGLRRSKEGVGGGGKEREERG